MHAFEHPTNLSFTMICEDNDQIFSTASPKMNSPLPQTCSSEELDDSLTHQRRRRQHHQRRQQETHGIPLARRLRRMRRQRFLAAVGEEYIALHSRSVPPGRRTGARVSKRSQETAPHDSSDDGDDDDDAASL